MISEETKKNMQVVESDENYAGKKNNERKQKKRRFVTGTSLNLVDL